MSALFNFDSMLAVLLLAICTCTYIRSMNKKILDANKEGFLGLLWKFARIGERLSPYVSAACVAMGLYILVAK